MNNKCVATIRYNRYFRSWDVLDYDGYLIASEKTPAEARRRKRIWFLYLSTKDVKLALDYLDGKVYVK